MADLTLYNYNIDDAVELLQDMDGDDLRSVATALVDENEQAATTLLAHLNSIVKIRQMRRNNNDLE